jgi:2-iminobutanoate/2-iminopropanoate deaminase
VSGQASVDPVTNEWDFGDVQHETRRTLDNIRIILEGSGATMRDVVKCTVFLRDGRDFSAMNEVYATFFGEAKPARSTVEVRFANQQMKVEIEAIAYRPKA